MRLAPAVAEEGFCLSCLHEPTLHPQLVQHLSWIPPTSAASSGFHDLARPLPEEEIEALAQSGLRHIDVALDTSTSSCSRSCANMDDTVFRHNLERLVDHCRRTPRAPPLRYIAMAFRSNRDESWPRPLDERIGLASDIRSEYTLDTWEHGASVPGRAGPLRATTEICLAPASSAGPSQDCVLGVSPPTDYDEQEPTLFSELVRSYNPPPSVTTPVSAARGRSKTPAPAPALVRRE